MCWFSPKKIEDNILYISTQLKQKGFDYLFLQILFLKVQMCRFINFFLSYLSLFFAKFEENIIYHHGYNMQQTFKTYTIFLLWIGTHLESIMYRIFCRSWIDLFRRGSKNLFLCLFCKLQKNNNNNCLIL